MAKTNHACACCGGWLGNCSCTGDSPLGCRQCGKCSEHCQCTETNQIRPVCQRLHPPAIVADKTQWRQQCVRAIGDILAYANQGRNPMELQTAMARLQLVLNMEKP